MDTEFILQHFGWTIESESPFELRHKDGSVATKQAASYLIDALQNEYIIEKYEELSVDILKIRAYAEMVTKAQG